MPTPATRTVDSLAADPAYDDFHHRDVSAEDLVLCVGNCQVDSVRDLLGTDLVGVRVPPVFELSPEHLPRLHALLARTRLLVVQPVQDGYRGLPLGTAELVRALPRGARRVVVPIVRYLGLHPTHAVFHPPGRPEPTPVPYHDLRVLHAALTGRPAPALTPTAVRRVAEASLAELRRREAGADVVVSDLLAQPTAEHMRTLNHPGNPVWTATTERVAAAARAGGVAAHALEPDGPLLADVVAPVEPAVAATWDVPERADWWVGGAGGRAVGVDEVAEEHRAFYADHPDVAAALAEREAPRLAVLGLS